MKIKLTLLFFILIIFSLAYFTYPIIKSRYFTSDPKTIVNKPAEQQSEIESINTPTPDDEGEIKSSTIDATVLPSDCDNECKNFQNADALKYCQQVCEIAVTEGENIQIKPTTDCATISGLEKDYCLKDLAVKNKDYKACDQINDSGIKKTCKDRVTEDIIENQTKLDN